MKLGREKILETTKRCKYKERKREYGMVVTRKM